MIKGLAQLWCFFLNHFLIYKVLCGARNKGWKTALQRLSAEL